MILRTLETAAITAFWGASFTMFAYGANDFTTVTPYGCGNNAIMLMVGASLGGGIAAVLTWMVWRRRTAGPNS